MLIMKIVKMEQKIYSISWKNDLYAMYDFISVTFPGIIEDDNIESLRIILCNESRKILIIS